LLTHLKKPEVGKFQIDLEVKDSSGMTELKNTLRALAEQQSSLIESGTTTREIAAAPLLTGPSDIVEGEFTESESNETKP
jgi:hypothetical protein